MLVKELLSKLSTIDPDLPVVMCHRETSLDTLVQEVSVVTIKYSKDPNVPKGTLAVFINETHEPYDN